MKYCPDCRKKLKSKDIDYCCFCGYSIISVLNREVLDKNLLEEKIDRFYEEYIEQSPFSLKQLLDEEHDYYLLPSILYFCLIVFYGFYAVVAFLSWPAFSKEKNIFELLVFSFPVIYLNLNLFTIRSAIKKNRENSKIDKSNIKELILDRLQLKWKGSIDSIGCYNNSFLFFGYSCFFLFIFYIPIYDPINQVIVLLFSSLAIDYLIFKLDIFGPKTRIYNDTLIIKRHFSRKNRIVYWLEIESVKVVINRDEYSNSFFKLYLKNHKNPVKVSFSISNEEILAIKKKFVEFMSSTIIDYIDKKPITWINDSKDKTLEIQLKHRNCSNCGTILEENAFFCHICGKEINIEMKFCPYCGKYKVNEALFCHICGSTLKIPIIELKQIDNTVYKRDSQKSRFCSLCGSERNSCENICVYCGNDI